MKTLPSPMATPRLSHPQQTVVMFWSISDEYFQSTLPVATSTRNTSSLPVGT